MRSSVSVSLQEKHGEFEADGNTPSETDVIDAAFLIANHHQGGVRDLAARMGVSANVLQNKLNPNNTTHHLTLRESIALQVMANNPAILHAMAAQLGYTCTPAIPDQSGGDPVEAFMAMQREQGEFTAAAADALQGEFTAAAADALHGGAQPSRNALRRVKHQANELMAAVGHLVATVAARTPKG